jgi:flagellar assembly factor FliW
LTNTLASAETAARGGSSIDPTLIAGATALIDEAPRQNETVIGLPRGLPGFATARGFTLEPAPTPGSRFMRLRSREQPELSFLVLPVPPELRLLAADDLDAACGELRIEPEDLLLLLMVTLQRGATRLEAFANLRAPLFVDSARRLAWQVVLPSAAYPVRYPLQAPR